jgi:hypothetical protein
MKRRKAIEAAVLAVVTCIALRGYGDTALGNGQAVNPNVQVTYKVLSGLPVPERRAVFAQLAATAKTDLWQLHLDTYVLEHPDLTNEQLAVLEEAMRLLHAGIFSDEIGGDDRQSVNTRLTDLQIAAMEVFAHNEQVEIFGILGARPTTRSEPASNGSTPATSTPGSRNWRVTANPVITNVDCECSIQSDLCWSGYWCKASTCRSTGMGCGWYWAHPCDGLCQKAY